MSETSRRGIPFPQQGIRDAEIAAALDQAQNDSSNLDGTSPSWFIVVCRQKGNTTYVTSKSYAFPHSAMFDAIRLVIEARIEKDGDDMAVKLRRELDRLASVCAEIVRERAAETGGNGDDVELLNGEDGPD